jgi:MoxR-like ATPase
MTIVEKWESDWIRQRLTGSNRYEFDGTFLNRERSMAIDTVGEQGERAHRLWCIYVARSAADNLTIAREKGTWGSNRESVLIGVKSGDEVLFVHDLQPEEKVKGWPRVPAEHYQGTAKLIMLAVATSDVYEDDSRVWADDVYPYRFRFRILSEEPDSTFSRQIVPADVIAAVRDSNVRRKAIPISSIGATLTPDKVREAETIWQVFSGILDLQSKWADHSTPDMDERGRLIRKRGPALLRSILPNVGELPSGWEVEGSDGSGRKSRVPWIRVFDKEYSPSATEGWYVVFLFAFDGTAVYLSLNQGTTQGSGLQRRSGEYLVERVQWARSHLGQITDGRLLPHIELHDPHGLGQGYEKGNVVAYRYGADSEVPEAQLHSDLKTMLQLLSQLHSTTGTTTASGRSIEPAKTHASSPPSPHRSALTDQWLLERTLWSHEALDDLLSAIRGSASSVVLAGPPGTGKTWVAQAIARYITQDRSGCWRLVQFHPSYSYESFIEGLRPVAVDGAVSFEIVPGVVLRMAEEAREAPEVPYLILIDEMNRANLPRVLGELLFLFEYRDRRIDLQYTADFALPPNLRFLGTMNTADRSIRSIDAALRRRIEIFECLPSVEILRRFYVRQEHRNHVDDLFDGFIALNNTLETQLDRHHTIGQTFFMTEEMTPGRLRQIWHRKLMPLIEEYFFDMPDTVEEFEVGKFWPSVGSA